MTLDALNRTVTTIPGSSASARALSRVMIATMLQPSPTSTTISSLTAPWLMRPTVPLKRLRAE